MAATSSDTPSGITGHNAVAPSSTSIHPSTLPSKPTETTKSDLNQTEAATDPTIAPPSESSNTTKPKTSTQNLAGLILEALQDEVDHGKASRKSGGKLNKESVAEKILGSQPSSKNHSNVHSPETNSVQSSAITSSSDVSKTPVATSTPKDEASAAVENNGVDAPKTSAQNAKPHSPFQKYSPLITAAPGTHTAPPGTMMGAPPKANKESKPHEEMGNSTLPEDKPTANRPEVTEKTKHQKIEDGEFVSSGTKNSPAKKTTGPHHHEILNKLDPRVHSHKNGTEREGVAV